MSWYDLGIHSFIHTKTDWSLLSVLTRWQSYLLNLLKVGLLAAFSLVNTVWATCVPPPLDMVAWYPLDEQVGETALDYVSVNYGTHKNGPAHVLGKVGYALSFDGIDDYVEVPNEPSDPRLPANPNIPSLNFGTGDFSIDLWIKPDDNQGIKALLDKSEATKQGYYLYLDSGKVGLRLADDTNYTTDSMEIMVS
jgi:hypothetical protein